MNDYTTQRRKRLERLEALKRRNGLALLPSDRPALRGRQSSGLTEPPSQLRSPLLKRPKQRAEALAGADSDSVAPHLTPPTPSSKPAQPPQGPNPRPPSGRGLAGTRPFSWHTRPNVAQAHHLAGHPSNEGNIDKAAESLRNRASSYHRPTPTLSPPSTVTPRRPGRSPLLDTRPQPACNQENDSPPNSRPQRSALPSLNRQPATSVAPVADSGPTLASHVNKPCLMEGREPKVYRTRAFTHALQQQLKNDRPAMFRGTHHGRMFGKPTTPVAMPAPLTAISPQPLPAPLKATRPRSPAFSHCPNPTIAHSQLRSPPNSRHRLHGRAHEGQGPSSPRGAPCALEVDPTHRENVILSTILGQDIPTAPQPLPAPITMAAPSQTPSIRTPEVPPQVVDLLHTAQPLTRVPTLTRQQIDEKRLKRERLLQKRLQREGNGGDGLNGRATPCPADSRKRNRSPSGSPFQSTGGPMDRLAARLAAQCRVNDPARTKVHPALDPPVPGTTACGGRAGLLSHTPGTPSRPPPFTFGTGHRLGVTTLSPTADGEALPPQSSFAGDEPSREFFERSTVIDLLDTVPFRMNNTGYDKQIYYNYVKRTDPEYARRQAPRLIDPTDLSMDLINGPSLDMDQFGYLDFVTNLNQRAPSPPVSRPEQPEANDSATTRSSEAASDQSDHLASPDASTPVGQLIPDNLLGLCAHSSSEQTDKPTTRSPSPIESRHSTPDLSGRGDSALSSPVFEKAPRSLSDAETTQPKTYEARMSALVSAIMQGTRGPDPPQDETTQDKRTIQYLLEQNLTLARNVDELRQDLQQLRQQFDQQHHHHRAA
ncbi:hypothetical protein H4R35_003470 [Dimargaris xerosporica]|nr:hypothetical protein H4R35_003470 [Dimargaris xerosporica]